MNKKISKMIFLGMALLMLFSLAGCGHPIDKFNSLEEMRAAMYGKTQLQEDLYFFDFQHEDVKEAGRYEATKKKWLSDDTEYTYFRYYIWYDIEYQVSGQIQKRKLVVAATYHTRPIGLSSKHLGLNVSAKGEIESREYFYYFYLENMKGTISEHEKEIILSICEQAINNRYQFSQA